MTGAIGVYAFLFFLPLILRNGLGYTQQMSFILSAPPALFSVFVAFGISWLADKTRLRGPYVVAQGIISIIGLCMTGFLTAPTPRYIGTFLGEAGMNGLVVTCLAWQANNVRGDAKRAVATAVQIMASGIGGIYSSLVFRRQVSFAAIESSNMTDLSGRSKLPSRYHCCDGSFFCLRHRRRNHIFCALARE